MCFDLTLPQCKTINILLIIHVLNCRFIGELFKLKMLVEAIMHDCIFKLLKNGDEESLECMCGLLRTIGKDLDNDKAKVIVNISINHCTSF